MAEGAVAGNGLLLPCACVTAVRSRATGIYVVTSEREDAGVSESAQYGRPDAREQSD